MSIVELAGSFQTLEAQLPINWVPVLKSLHNFILSVTQGPTVWVPGLLGKSKGPRLLTCEVPLACGEFCKND